MNFIANIPIRIALVFKYLMEKFTDLGMYLHMKFNTPLGQQIRRLNDTLKDMGKLTQKIQQKVNQEPTDEDSKLANIIKGND